MLLLDKVASIKPVVPLITGLFLFQGQMTPTGMPEVAIVESITKLGAFGLSMFFNFQFWREIGRLQDKKDSKDELIIKLTGTVTEALTSNKIALEMNINILKQMGDLIQDIKRNVDRIDNVRAFLEHAGTGDRT